MWSSFSRPGFLSSWWTRSNSGLGVDISNTALKLVELAWHQGKLQVLSWARVALPAGAVSDGLIQDAAVVTASLQRLLAMARPLGRRTAVALPLGAVITRTLTVPAGLSSAEAEALVWAEVQEQLPYALDTVALDFIVQPTIWSAEAEPQISQQLLVVACRQELIQQLDAVVKAAGLQPAIIEVENLANERALVWGAQDWGADKLDSVLALIDLGASTTKACIVDAGLSVYVHEQDFNSQQLLQSAGVVTNTSHSASTLSAVHLAWAQHLERQLQLFFASTSYQHLDAVFIAGGWAQVPNLAEYLTQYLGYPTFVANPFRQLGLHPKLDATALPQQSPALVTACGLALRAIKPAGWLAAKNRAANVVGADNAG